MCRELKFRVWDKDAQRMSHDINIGFTTWGTTIVEIDYGEAPYFADESARIDNFVVQQFTGLKDRNGKDIYEGDILRVQSCDGLHYNLRDWEEEFVEVKIGIYNEETQHYGVFYTSVIEGDCSIENFDLAEIVGNVYENADLLSTSIPELLND